MILEEYMQIHIDGKNIQYYLDKGYNAKINENLLVKNEDVSSNSKTLERRICDIDGKEYVRPHRAWINTNACFGIDLCPACAKKYTLEKTKQTNLEKYGVEFPMQSKQVKQKAINTCLKNYGCAYSFQNQQVQEKAKEVIQTKYGVNSVMELPDTVKKVKETNLERYGVVNVFQSKEVRSSK